MRLLNQARQILFTITSIGILVFNQNCLSIEIIEIFIEIIEILKRGFPLNWLDMTRLSGKRFQYCFSERKATSNYVHKDTNSIIAFPKYTVYIKQFLMLPQVLVVN